ncbi:MAG: T9SS type A sorting domain-containing protein [Salinivirgaceae bacterium]|nr:T9SS type A sorting domain-containing protein [Salinivirgaceae bacterium]
MKKTLLKSMLAFAVMFGMASNVAKAEIDNKDNARKGEVYRWESNNPGDYDQLCEPDNGVYGLYTYAADAADWDSQFFLVFADEVLPSGKTVHISFDYKKGDEGAVQFNAQGHANPHTYVNNDGFAPLTCTDDWQTLDTTITTSGEIRTFALNCSMARADGILLLRNILIEVNFEEALATEETEEDECEDLGERPVVELDTVIAPAPKDLLGENEVGGDTVNVAESIFQGRDSRWGGKQFAATTVKYGEDDVYAFYLDTNLVNAWDAQFFVMFDAVSPSAKKAMVLNLEFSTNYSAAGGFNVHNGGNKNAKWGFATPDSAQWTKFTDTVYVYDGVAGGTDSLSCWEFHIGGKAVGQGVVLLHNSAYNVFFRNVDLQIDPEGVEPPAQQPGGEGGQPGGEGGSAVLEAAAVNAFVAGDVLYASEAADVVIYNISGVAVKAAKKVTSLSVSDLKSGLYIAKVGNKAIKFVK